MNYPPLFALLVMVTVWFIEGNLRTALADPEQVEILPFAPRPSPSPVVPIPGLVSPSLEAVPEQASPVVQAEIDTCPGLVEADADTSTPQPEVSEPTPSKVLVNDIVAANGIFANTDKARFDAAVESYKGRELLAQDLIDLKREIDRLYARLGYITSIARQPTLRQVQDGTLKVDMIEGALIQINLTVDGTRRLDKSYVCSRILRGVDVPLNTNQLEDQLKLLRIDPLFEYVEASLAASSTGDQQGHEGESILNVRIKEAEPSVVNFSADNYSPPSIGSERFSVNARYRNLTGLGDEISGSYSRTITGGADVFDFTYLVPLNAMNGTLLLRAAPNRTEITQAQFQDLDIRGTQAVYQLEYRQPIVRSSDEELALSLGFLYQSGLTLLNGEPLDINDVDQGGISRTSVIQFSQDYLRRDGSGAWLLRSQFNFGTGLFDATINQSPIPDSRFFSWLGQVRRVQRFGDDHIVLMQGDVQLTPDPLLSSQQFVIGGSQSVRGYRQNVRSGDNGLRVSVEDRIAIVRNRRGDPSIQLVPFVDAGLVWNQAENLIELPKQRFLLGAGLGLLLNEPFSINGLNVRVEYGFPFIDLSDREGNIQDDGLYFGVFYQP
ncbi:MAG: BamA/TamA family outer membrane protein [Timaviella obliquedivisa GSE-PSE-MK23-08B]|jgi:hemolysin activation/secretion protein|nr:BamA/TamA family outer membrane protein [Timaviella obliquedivisa GSE-PSE-MK23-08B]